MYKLGSDGFGQWMILQSLLALAFVADFGIAPSTTLFIARYNGKHDRVNMLRILKGSFTLYLVFAVICFIGFLKIGPYLFTQFKVGALITDSPVYFLPVFTVCMLFQLFHSLIDAVFRGLERYDIESTLRVLTDIFTILGILVIAVLGGTIQEMILYQAAVAMFALGSGILLLSKNIHSYGWLKPFCSLVTFREIFKVGIYGGIQGISSVLFNQVDKLILATYLGPTATGYYAACMQLTLLAHGLIAKSLNFLFPKFAGTPKENLKAMQEIFTKGMVLSTLCGCMMSLILFSFGDVILQHWLGMDLPRDIFLTLKILAVVNAFHATSIVPYTLLMGRGAFHLGALFGFLSFCLVTGSAFWLIPAFGMIGAAVAKLSFVFSSLISRAVIMRITLAEKRWWIGILQIIPVVLTFGTAWGFYAMNAVILLSPLVLYVLQLTISSTVLILSTKIIYRKWFWNCI